MTRTEEHESRGNASDVGAPPYLTGHLVNMVRAGENLEMCCSHFYQDHRQQPAEDELCDLSDTAPVGFRTALPDEPPSLPFNQEHYHYTGRDSPPFLYPHPRGVPEPVATEVLCDELLVGVVGSPPV